MKKKKKLVKVLGVALMSTMLLSTVAVAGPQSKPNGPYVEVEQNLSLQSFMSNDQLYSKLQQLELRSNGKMKLDIAGYSDAMNGDLMEQSGYPLYVVKFGDADPNKKKVLITSQIHGNEPIGTEAIIELVQTFLSESKEVNEILENVTVWFMPRINPDGAANLYQDKLYPVRYTHQTWDPEEIGLPEGTKAPWNYNLGTERAQANNGQINYGIPGYDENRDYNPNLDFRIEKYVEARDEQKVIDALNDTSYYVKDENGNYITDENGNRVRHTGLNSSDYGGFYVTPEARIVTEVFKELDPDVYFDLHHRGFNTLTAEDDRSVPIQIAAVVADPYVDPFTGKSYEVDDDVLTLGKQINVLGYQSLQKGNSSFGAIQKYPDVNLPGTSLGAFALNDTAIMLIEVKGQSQTLGQKQSGMLTQTVKIPVYEILKGLGDGSVNDINPNLYNDIPVSANGIKDPSVRD